MKVKFYGKLRDRKEMRLVMKKMVYKGIRFDDWVDDKEDNGEDFENYWSEICEKCWNKYKNIFGENRMDDSGSGEACCGIDGCNSKDAYIYIDFQPDEVEFVG